MSSISPPAEEPIAQLNHSFSAVSEISTLTRNSYEFAAGYHSSAGLFEKRATIETVRHYTNTRIENGSIFQCIHCDHRVSTLQFQRENGNCRTQAATAINQHAATVHHKPMLISANAQQRVWRG
jgi:hypothetical protein